jgi:hypothetical protein
LHYTHEPGGQKEKNGVERDRGVFSVISFLGGEVQQRSHEVKGAQEH